MFGFLLAKVYADVIPFPPSPEQLRYRFILLVVSGAVALMSILIGIYILSKIKND